MIKGLDHQSIGMVIRFKTWFIDYVQGFGKML